MPSYVSDTHSLIWYLSASLKLGDKAKAVFDQACFGQAKVIIPIIVIAETIFLIEKHKLQIDIEEILKRISKELYYEIKPLGLNQIPCLKRLKDIPAIHNRLIVCEALLNKAKLITSDERIKQAGIVEIIW